MESAQRTGAGFPAGQAREADSTLEATPEAEELSAWHLVSGLANPVFRNEFARYRPEDVNRPVRMRAVDLGRQAHRIVCPRDSIFGPNAAKFVPRRLRKRSLPDEA
jgi:hypothetical protein